MSDLKILVMGTGGIGETLNGTVSRMGSQFKIPTPINDFIYASLKLHDPQLV